MTTTPTETRTRDARRYFWVSWYQPPGDHRPMTDPPTEQVLGWWCTGYDMEDRATICAAVAASTEQEVWAAIRDPKNWPDASTDRFCESRLLEDLDNLRVHDRFPKRAWMVERITAILTSKETP